MRALGAKGGSARHGVKPKNVPSSLRDELRKLDPAIVRTAIEQALLGGNESARVSAVKLLADIELYREDDNKVDRPREMAVGAAERGSYSPTSSPVPRTTNGARSATRCAWCSRT
jgi:hypothetical protein